MPTRKNIGLRLHDLRLQTRDALAAAARIGFAAVELSADHPETSPRALSDTGRRHLARLVRDQGLSPVSIGSETQGRGMADPGQADRLVGEARRVLRLAADMGVPIVSHDVGGLPDLDGGRGELLMGALRAIAEEADLVGTIYAVGASRMAPGDLRRLIDTVNCAVVRISVDPGALLLAGVEPTAAVGVFGDRLALAYVRDAVRGSPPYPGHETALGRGAIDLPAYLAGLAACGCGQPPIICRHAAADPWRDLAADRKVLEANLPA